MPGPNSTGGHSPRALSSRGMHEYPHGECLDVEPLHCLTDTEEGREGDTLPPPVREP